MGEVPESTRTRFDGLDLRVEPFGHGVGDVVCTVREESRKVALEHLRYLDERFETGMRRTEVPAIEERTCGALPHEVPEVTERFLERPRAPGFEFLFHERTEPSLFVSFEFILQEEVARTFQCLITLLEEGTILAPPHRVHRFA